MSAATPTEWQQSCSARALHKHPDTSKMAKKSWYGIKLGRLLYSSVTSEAEGAFFFFFHSSALAEAGDRTTECTTCDWPSSVRSRPANVDGAACEPGFRGSATHQHMAVRAGPGLCSLPKVQRGLILPCARASRADILNI